MENIFEIKVKDRANNEIAQKRYFRIDSKPPEIYVIQKMDSILTKNKKYIEFKFKVNEWANFKLFLKNKYDTSIKYIKEINALPDSFYDTLLNNKIIILSQ
jgi:uncharacterized membrane protein